MTYSFKTPLLRNCNRLSRAGHFLRLISGCRGANILGVRVSFVEIAARNHPYHLSVLAAVAVVSFFLTIHVCEKRRNFKRSAPKRPLLSSTAVWVWACILRVSPECPGGRVFMYPKLS